MDEPSTSTPTAFPVESEEKRLWIGNLDTRITEYQLIKLVQRFGKIDKFDLLFHRSGPLEGQPRGYAFVSYAELSDATTAKAKLHGLKLGTKHIAVKWAHAINTEDYDKPKPVPELPALAGAKSSKTSCNKTDTIQAIEAKLRVMESSQVEPDFTGRTLSDLPAVWKPPAPTAPSTLRQKTSRSTGRDRHRDRRKAWPYPKTKLR